MSGPRNEAVDIVIGELRKTLEEEERKRAIAAGDQVTKLRSQVETLTSTIDQLTIEKIDLETRLKSIEALPQPAKGKLRLVDKSYDLGDGNG